jgi:hypothetical protein
MKRNEFYNFYSGTKIVDLLTFCLFRERIAYNEATDYLYSAYSPVNECKKTCFVVTNLGKAEFLQDVSIQNRKQKNTKSRPPPLLLHPPPPPKVAKTVLRLNAYSSVNNEANNVILNSFYS